MKAQVFLRSARRVVACLVVAPTFVCAQGKVANIDALMTRYHDAGQFNGSVLVAEQGSVIYRKSFGFANFEWDIPNTPDTRFRVGSITKAFTAILVLQLVEQGKLRLDDTISEYLPNFSRESGGRISINQLLTHTSGLSDYNDVPEFFRAVHAGLLTKDEIIDRISRHNLLFEPGAKFGYSNDGYMVLGAIIERVAHKPYAQLLREQILDPVNMRATGYSSRSAILKRGASGYTKRSTGLEKAPFYEASSASGIYSTVDDLFLFDQALYGEELLSRRSKGLMWQIVPSGNAYGWHVSRVRSGRGEENLKVMAEGAVFGFFARYVRLPHTGQTIIMLTNVRGSANFLPDIERSLTSILRGTP